MCGFHFLPITTRTPKPANSSAGFAVYTLELVKVASLKLFLPYLEFLAQFAA